VLGSFKIGSVFGITLRVHWLFLVLIGVLAFSDVSPLGLTAPLAKLAAFALLGAVVVLHELGHSLVARAFGLRVLDITLWPLGGMARMSEMPEVPRIEALIALAGPAVNFVLAALGFAVWVGMLSLGTPVEDFDVAGFHDQLGLYFVFSNLMLGTFNLVPAFPMDGGRVLRAFLGLFGDWLTATRRAVTIGKVFALAMVAAGVLLPGAVMMAVIGVFVWFAGSRELFAVRLRHGEVAGFGPRPVDFYTEAPQSPPRGGEADPSGARRPIDPPALRSGSGGLSDEDIARLERFQGRLRRYDPE
jgi:Zn-dependent protease